jgi:hypothetical protein
MCIPPATVTPDHASQPREINEAILAAIWNEQAHLRGPMWACTGQPVAVVYRGRWSGGSGPDFDGAMLALGDTGARLTTGAVELHLRCADWYAHGHDVDPRYNGVVLHVVLWPLGAKPVRRADGVEIPTLVLADYITLPTADLLERVTPLVADLGTLSDEPCWQRTQHWPVARLVEQIEVAGDDRLRAKAARMEAGLHTLDDPGEVLYHGLMDALGYSANREPMKALAEALPLSQLRALPLPRDASERTAVLEAVLLGAAGLLPSQRSEPPPPGWLDTEYGEEVERLWAAHREGVGVPASGVPNLGWQTNRVRPANSPSRRLAAAARLLSLYLPAADGLFGPFLRAADDLAPEELAGEWTGMLTVPGEGYWAARSDFGRAVSSVPSSSGDEDDDEVALIGKSRAADMVVNIVLPLALAYANVYGTPGLRDKAEAVYTIYPKLSDNRVTRAMTEEVFGPRKRGAIKTARHQQGLLHLYRMYCEARRCHECPVSGLKGMGV